MLNTCGKTTNASPVPSVTSSLNGIPELNVINPKMENIFLAAVPILYAGVMSCGVAYTLQILGQKNMKPAIASLILSLESVISVLAGWLILNEILTARQLWGCGLLFVAVILAQIPVKNE